MSTYAFIDAGYVIEEMRRFSRGVLPQETARPDFGALKAMCKATRALVYYAAEDPPPPRDGESEDPAAAARRQELEATLKWYGGVQRIPGVHVRMGVVKAKTGRKPRVQKEVDVMLSVDMLTNAFRGNVQRAVLVAGDLDFHPLVQAVVDTGCQVTVCRETQCRGRADRRGG